LTRDGAGPHTGPRIGPRRHALHDGAVSVQTHKVITPTGTFAMTIHATSGTLEHSVAISLTIR